MKVKSKTFDVPWWNQDKIELFINGCTAFDFRFRSDVRTCYIRTTKEFIDNLPLTRIRLEVHHFDVKDRRGHAFGSYDKAIAFIA